MLKLLKSLFISHGHFYSFNEERAYALNVEVKKEAGKYFDMRNI